MWRSTTLLQLIDEISNLLGKKAIVHFAEHRKGDVKYSTADITLAIKSLQYISPYDLRKGLQETIAYYQSLLQPEKLN